MIAGWVLNVHDITSRKRAEQELSRRAVEDPLTGLPNRAALRTRIVEAMSASTGVALLFCDVNGFKRVNDTYGHDSGDHVLRSVAGRWSALLRADDVLGRWGGDEFLVICSPPTGAEAAYDVAQWLLEALREPLDLDICTAEVGVSIGIAHPLPAENADALIARTDAAMYQAKRSNGTPLLVA